MRVGRGGEGWGGEADSCGVEVGGAMGGSGSGDVTLGFQRTKPSNYIYTRIESRIYMTNYKSTTDTYQ